MELHSTVHNQVSVGSGSFAELAGKHLPCTLSLYLQLNFRQLLFVLSLRRSCQWHGRACDHRPSAVIELIELIEFLSTSVFHFPRHDIRIEAHAKVLFSSSSISEPITAHSEAHPARVRSSCRAKNAARAECTPLVPITTPLSFTFRQEHVQPASNQPEKRASQT